MLTQNSSLLFLSLLLMLILTINVRINGVLGNLGFKRKLTVHISKGAISFLFFHFHLVRFKVDLTLLKNLLLLCTLLGTVTLYVFKNILT